MQNSHKLLDFGSFFIFQGSQLFPVFAGLGYRCLKSNNLQPVETKSFNFNTFTLNPESSPPDFMDQISKWEKIQKSNFVYYFSLTRDADLEQIHKKITEAKREKLSQRAYPRINLPSSCLYVGSSRDLANRVKGHLGFGHKGTYAMNLAYWCSDLDLQIQIVCLRYNANANKNVIQAFEDGLWDHLKPLLGRQGPR